MSFEKAYKEFEKYVRNRHKKQGFYNITHDFKCRVLPYFSNFDISEISKLDLLDWQDKILTFNFTNSYNARLYYVFNYFLDYCCDFLGLENNLLREIGSFPKHIEEKKTDFYTLKEFKKFISCMDNIVYRTYFVFMFYTGVRPGECMALKFSDLQGSYIKINKSLQRKGKRELDTPKNQSSIRTIVINSKLIREILKLKDYYIKVYGYVSDDDFIFGCKKPLSPTSIDRYKKSACDKAHLRVITQHQFRHSHATMLINNNIPVNEVSKRLGHSKISTTTDIYVHQDLSQEKRVLRTLNSRFRFYNPTHDFKYLLKHFSMF